MSTTDETPSAIPWPIHRRGQLILAVWTAIVGGSLAWNVANERQQSYELALGAGRANFGKDQAYRLWATEHGGVYVRPTERTPPNPYLAHLPERDVVTSRGIELTLMNPAYMLRQMMADYSDLYGIKGRIVGLRALNPKNIADPWEAKAIGMFAEGAEEFVELAELDGESHLRLMGPMYMTPGCVKCHGHLGYQDGDLRGAVGVSVPMAPYERLADTAVSHLLISHGVIWCLGLVTIVLTARRSELRAIERRQERAKVDGLNRELESRIRELDDHARRLIELDKLKDAFLANTSHELRTPLHGMIGIADTLIDGAAGPVTGPQAAELSLIVASGRRLASMVDDILDFSRLEHHDVELRRSAVDLWSVAEVVTTLTRPLIRGRPIELVHRISAELPAVLADEDRVQQILYNLVGNALKFTESGRVEITATTEGNTVAVTVADTGVGIPSDALERIFEPFRQADGSVARSHGGTGLGLSITRHLLDLHGGDIRGESTLGQGSRFTFELPVAPAGTLVCAPTPAIAPSTPPPESIDERRATPDPRDAQRGGGRLLVVDDEPINRRVISNRLELEGYAVVEAGSGEEALGYIEREGPPDLVLLDVMMPRMSGYDVCRKLRERYPIESLPVVMLTAKNRITDLVEGFESGANDYLTKPFSNEELSTRTRFHLELKREVDVRRKAEARFRSLFEELPIAIWVADLSEIRTWIGDESSPDYRAFETRLTDDLGVRRDAIGRARIVDVNDFSVRMFDAPDKRTLLGAAPALLTKPTQRVFAQMLVALARGEPRFETKTVIETLAGRPLTAEITVAVTTDSRDTWARVIIAIADVTEREVLEERLAHAQRLEAVGRMASGIAHDFNNLLMVISGYVHLLNHQLPGAAELRSISGAIDRATAMTHELLSFGRSGELDARIVDLDALIEETDPLARALVGDGIDLRCRRAPAGPKTVCGDAGKLQRVLLNLVANARDAMPDGGLITIATDVVVVGDDARLRHPLAPGAYIQLEVTDTGTGIDAATRARLFEPFFTTKPPGKGTGLGLATAFGIIRQHGGDIEVESEPGRGSQFRILLPQSDAAPAERPSPAPEEPAPACARRGGQLLLVEDREAVRSLMVRILAAAGYEVLAASGPSDALERWRTSRADIGLLVTDVVMPGATGAELAAQLREDAAELPVLYVSGHPRGALGARELSRPSSAFLSKPFSPTQLLDEVARLLASNERRGPRPTS